MPATLRTGKLAIAAAQGLLQLQCCAVPPVSTAAACVAGHLLRAIPVVSQCRSFSGDAAPTKVYGALSLTPRHVHSSPACDRAREATCECLAGLFL